MRLSPRRGVSRYYALPGGEGNTVLESHRLTFVIVSRLGGAMKEESWEEASVYIPGERGDEVTFSILGKPCERS